MKNLILLSLALAVGQPLMSFAGQEGGGGDPTEIRVDEIRSDLLAWIKKGGANGLELRSLSVAEYESRMSEILQPKQVQVTFVENDASADEELRVIVDGKPKTCRGFISVKDHRRHIVCNIPRFKSISDAEEYKLIHHEFAGLAGVEHNDGATSDYEISKQITDFLTEKKELKLGLKKKQIMQVDQTQVMNFNRDSFKGLPKGSLLVLTKAFSIPARSEYISLGYVSDAHKPDEICDHNGCVHFTSKPTISCALKLKPSDKDRVINSERVLVGLETEYESSEDILRRVHDETLLVKKDGEELFRLTCTNRDNSRNFQKSVSKILKGHGIKFQIAPTEKM
jgi:hypothetical protein